jgi:predicted metal-dependent HD superfamily phosphohydrolase
LAAVESLRCLAQNFAAVQLAAWLHDVVYETQAEENEEQSAAYAGRLLQRLALPAEVIATCQRLILTTKGHRAGPDPDSPILLDADLAILGAAEPDYARYARAIRQEYAWVPEEQYRHGRTRVLQGFLQRGRIYLTEPMFQALEARARANVTREIQSLG